MRPLMLSLLVSLLSLGLAQIGESPQAFLRQLSPVALSETATGYRSPGGFDFALETRAELVYRLEGQGLLDEANLPFAARLIGVASGYGEGIARPVQEFFEQRLDALAGQGVARLDVEGYTLELEVTGERAPYEVALELYLPEVPADAFPAATHSLGPVDAPYVIRAFSDFQCPFCARFAEDVYPQLKEELLSRGDVRFEFHHFPLLSIHANAQLAAEAAECVSAVNGEDAFWTYHDALFERQAAWQDLNDPSSYFVRLAQEVGLESEGVASCLDERRYAEEIRGAYEHAGGILRLSGTPSVFVNGYKLGDYTQLEGYLELMRLADAFGRDE